MPDENQNDLLRLANLASRKMVLDDLSLTSANFQRSSDLPSQEEFSLKYKSRFRVEYNYFEEQKKLVVEVEFTSVGDSVTEDEEERELFRVDATFGIVYLTRNEEVIEDQALEAFAKLNGAYNAWPYWREFLQSCTVRMGLPPVTQPLMTAASLVERITASDNEDDTSDEPSQP